MQVETVKKSYARNSNKWNVATMLTLGAALYAVMGYFVASELRGHSTAENAHPAITLQMQTIVNGQNSIKGDLKKAEIMRVDNLICADPDNAFYLNHILNLITEWERITSNTFPQQLLRCTHGNP